MKILLKIIKIAYFTVMIFKIFISSLFYFNFLNATKVNVYVIDSEIDVNHREFGNRADVVYSSSNCKVPTSHGTHIAGIIGGNKVGIDSSVLLHSVNVIGCDNKVDNMELAKAINWVTDNHQKPAIINMAMIPDSLIIIDPLDEAISRAIESGIIFVASAGNNGIDRCMFSPSRVKDIILVGSISDYFSISSFSNFGSCVTIFTHGEDILSASPNGKYEKMSGTSQATPLITGLIAKYLKNNKYSTQKDVIEYLDTISIKTEKYSFTSNKF